MAIELDLEKVIEDARKGDEPAIVALFRLFNPQLLRYLKHHVPYDYEDVASETWAAIAKGIPEFHGDSRDFRSWMFGIARNKTADYFRSTSKAKLALENQRNHFHNETHSESSDATAHPAIANLTAEEAIESLVSVLPPHHAEVLLLRVVADLSVEQVSKIMDKSPEAIRVIQHRAINTLLKRFNRNVVT